MILIADSGSTKTHWLSIDRSIDVKTLGLNPLTIPQEQIEEAVEYLSERCGNSMKYIFFYGAGCGNIQCKKIILSALNKYFPNTMNYVESDLLGACRALYGDNKGLAGILGTGSNTCYYDGLQISNKTFSMGYILGDEGSANHLGRIWLKLYLSNRVPKKLERLFQDSCSISKESWIYRIYHEPGANRLLASVAPFLSQNKSHPFIYELVISSLTDYFEQQVRDLAKKLKEDERNISFVGTVAKAFEEEVTLIANKFNIRVEKIIQSPIDKLVDYHKKK